MITVFNNLSISAHRRIRRFRRQYLRKVWGSNDEQEQETPERKGTIMKKSKSTSIEVQGTAISVVSQEDADYICLTDIARYRNPENTDDLIRNWLRNRNTVEFLGLWEQLNNPDFNPVEFDGIRMQAGLNSFTLSPKQWMEKTRSNRDHFKSRTLWRHLRPQGHCIRVCFLGIRRVQALPHQGVPAP